MNSASFSDSCVFVQGHWDLSRIGAWIIRDVLEIMYSQSSSPIICPCRRKYKEKAPPVSFYSSGFCIKPKPHPPHFQMYPFMVHRSVKHRTPAAMGRLMVNLLLFKDVGSCTRPRAGLLQSQMHQPRWDHGSKKNSNFSPSGRFSHH